MDTGITSEYIDARLASFRNFKGRTLRSGQKQALLRYHFFCQSDKRFFFLNAPPGSGKSLLGMLLLTAYRGVYLCSSKYLQDQIVNDFPEAKSLKGRSNYRCKRYHFLSCDACPKTGKIITGGATGGSGNDDESEGKKCPDCPYEKAKAEALSAAFVILNYAYFFAEANFIGKFSNREMIVCDEADLAESQLLGAVEVSIRKSWADKYDLPMPRNATTSTDKGVQVWIGWAFELVQRLKPEEVHMRRQLEDMAADAYFNNFDSAKEFINLKREVQHLTGAINKLTQFTLWADNTWIFQEEKLSFSFRPTWLTNGMFEHYFGRHCNSGVFMSGTLHPAMVAPKLLGIELPDSDYMEIKSTFPASNRPVYMRGVVNMSAKTWEGQMPVLVENIKKIIALWPNQRGIIHAVSYQLAKAIIDGVKDSRLMTHTGANKEDAIAAFMKSAPGTVLVSPSIIRGVDLKDDLCRFTIFPKCPFLTLGDKITSARAHAGTFGNIWYKSEAAQAIMQGACRGMRHENDQVATYILDQKAIDLFTENVSLFAQWFRESVMFV